MTRGPFAAESHQSVCCRLLGVSLQETLENGISLCRKTGRVQPMGGDMVWGLVKLPMLFEKVELVTILMHI